VHTVGIRRIPAAKIFGFIHRHAAAHALSGGDLGECELVSIDILDGKIPDAIGLVLDILGETDIFLLQFPVVVIDLPVNVQLQRYTGATFFFSIDPVIFCRYHHQHHSVL